MAWVIGSTNNKMMRSLVHKLTLAFLFVSIVGVLLVAVFMLQQTQHAFDNFLFSPERITPPLAGYYAATGSWENIDLFLAEQEDSSTRPRNYRAVVNLDGVIEYAEGDFVVGTQVSADELTEALPIILNDTTIGWVLVAPNPLAEDPRDPGAFGAGFLGDLTRSTIWSVIVGSAIALILGTWLARSLTRPVKALTTATQRMSQGELTQQVEVHSRDEIGALAASFNKMSHDLAQLSESRRQMTADIAHDLRTPITVLMGYTEPLRDGKLEGSPELYGFLHDEVLRLKHLVEDLRTLSLADTGELPLDRQPVNPQSLLEQTGLAYTPLAEQKEVTLQVQPAPTLPDIDVDAGRMIQVLGNLVDNALRFTPAGGTISLAAQQEPAGRIQIIVRDTGAGIQPEHLAHVFGRFYRADQSRNRDNNSSGLGLAISKSIVVAHGGTISAASRIDEGSTFTISLPVAAFHS